ncbi:BBE domain-containing protein [Streptomyces sp. NPDC003758]
MNLRGGYLPEVSPDVVDVLVKSRAAAPAIPNSLATISLSFMGGAISEADEDSTAFSREGAAWVWQGLSKWDAPEHDSTFDHWVNAFTEDMRPHSLRNCYLNFSDDLGERWRREAYGSAVKYQRLREVKAVWDPRNLLRYDKNITPAATG